LVQNRGLLWANTIPTFQATLLVFLLADGRVFIVGRHRFFRPWLRYALLLPIRTPTPPLVAIAPLVAVVRLDPNPKIMLVALVTFFRCWWRWPTDTHPWILKSRPCLRRWVQGHFRSSGARDCPAMPYFFGLRISITYAVVVIFFADISHSKTSRRTYDEMVQPGKEESSRS
jgi:ABC-type nitrate/sulfonate/bicarbonate transport system permease component